MQTSKEIFMPQTYDEYLRAVHTALVDAGVEMHDRTKECGKFVSWEGGGFNGYSRQRRDCNSVLSLYTSTCSCVVSPKPGKSGISVPNFSMSPMLNIL